MSNQAPDCQPSESAENVLIAEPSPPSNWCTGSMFRSFASWHPVAVMANTRREFNGGDGLEMDGALKVVEAPSMVAALTGCAQCRCGCYFEQSSQRYKRRTGIGLIQPVGLWIGSAIPTLCIPGPQPSWMIRLLTAPNLAKDGADTWRRYTALVCSRPMASALNNWPVFPLHQLNCVGHLPH